MLPDRFAANNMYSEKVGLAIGLSLVSAYSVYVLFNGLAPFGDEGSACVIAEGILDGRLPYRDLFNEKAPLQYFWTALVMHFSSDGLAGTRFAATLALFSALVCALCVLAAKKVPDQEILLWAIGVTLIAMVLGAYNNTADSALAPLFAVSGVIVFQDGLLAPKARGLVLGFLQGIACGFRQVALVGAVLLLAAPNSRFSKRTYVFGFMIGTSSWLLMIRELGIMQDALMSALLFHSNNPRFSAYFKIISPHHYSGLLVWLGCCALAVRTAYSRAGLREAAWLFAWLMAAAASFFARMDAFRLWPSALLAMVYLCCQLQWHVRNKLGLGLGVIGAIAVVSMERPESMWRSQMLADRIRALTQNSDTVWIGPFDPLSYCLSGRTPASKYYFVLPWTAKPSVREVILSDIRTRAPKLVIDESTSEFVLWDLVPGLQSHLSSQYRLVETSFGAHFYLRIDRRHQERSNGTAPHQQVPGLTHRSD